MQILHVEVTTRCNLRCAYCRLRAPWWVGSDLPLAVAEKLFAWAARQEVRPYCILQGHGEPLIHPDYLRLFSLASACCEGVEFQTNGVLLTPETTDRLLEAARGRWDRLKVSIDGADRSTYGATRPGADFDQVLAHIEYLAGRQGRPEIGIEAVVTAANWTATRELSALAARLGADRLQLSPLSAWDGAAGLVISDEAFRHAAEEACEAAPAGLTVTWQAEPRCQEGVCAEPLEVLFCSESGEVFPCCYTRTPLGDLCEASIEEVLAGDRRRKFLDYVAAVGACPDCAAWRKF